MKIINNNKNKGKYGITCPEFQNINKKKISQ